MSTIYNGPPPTPKPPLIAGRVYSRLDITRTQHARDGYPNIERWFETSDHAMCRPDAPRREPTEGGDA